MTRTKKPHTDALFGYFLFSDGFFLTLDYNTTELGKAPRRATKMIQDEEMHYRERTKYREQLSVLGVFSLENI